MEEKRCKKNKEKEKEKEKKKGFILFFFSFSFAFDRGLHEIRRGLQGFTLNTTPIHHDTWTDTDTFMRWHALASNDSHWRPSSRLCRVWVDFAF